MNRRSFLHSTGLLALSGPLAAQTSAADTIRIGNIGCGGRGTFVSGIIKENPGFQITAAADYFEDRVTKFGDAFGVPPEKRFTGLDGYKKMLEGVDAVAIHSPPGFHVQQAVDAATEAQRVARNRYEGGLARYLDVLSAEDQLLASVRQLVDVQSRALTLDIGLHRALGGGWSEPAPASSSTPASQTASAAAQ